MTSLASSSKAVRAALSSSRLASVSSTSFSRDAILSLLFFVFLGGREDGREGGREGETVRGREGGWEDERRGGTEREMVRGREGGREMRKGRQSHTPSSWCTPSGRSDGYIGLGDGRCARVHLLPNSIDLCLLLLYPPSTHLHDTVVEAEGGRGRGGGATVKALYNSLE